MITYVTTTTIGFQKKKKKILTRKSKQYIEKIKA